MRRIAMTIVVGCALVAPSTAHAAAGQGSTVERTAELAGGAGALALKSGIAAIAVATALAGATVATHRAAQHGGRLCRRARSPWMALSRRAAS